MLIDSGTATIENSDTKHTDLSERVNNTPLKPIEKSDGHMKNPKESFYKLWN